MEECREGGNRAYAGYGTFRERAGHFEEVKERVREVVRETAALPGTAPQDVVEYLLRGRLGEHSKGVVSTETLLLLLRADCRTKKDVRALSTEVLTALPPAAAAEVKQYLVLLLRKSLGRLSGII